MIATIAILCFLAGIFATFIWANFVVILERRREYERERTKIVSRIVKRIKRVHELTEEQLDLQRSVDGPSKGAAWAKHKNQINMRIRDMEEEKINIFKEMLDDGIDPTIGVISHDGTMSHMKTSELVEQAEAHLNNEAFDKTEPKINEKKDEKVVHINFRKGKKDADRSPAETD